MSASLARQVEGLGSNLQQSFLALSSDLSDQLAARISALSTSCSLTPSVSAPVRRSQALSPQPPVSTAGMLQESQALGAVDRNPKVFPIPSAAVLRQDSDRMVGEAVQSRLLPDAAAAPSAGVSHAPLAHDPDDGDDDVDDDDRESTISVTADRSAVRLANFVYDSYPGSCPVAAPPVAPQCDFEALYALFDPPESSHHRFAIYPRVSDILREVDDRAASLAQRSKPMSAVLPRKVRRYAVADSQHFSIAQPINPDFARLCGNKAVSNKCWGSYFCRIAEARKGVPVFT